MKLNRQILRKIILSEIKLLKEGAGTPKAVNGLLDVGGKKYQLSKGWYGDLNLKSIDILPDGSAKVVITKGPATREGVVSKKQVEKIVSNGKLGKEFIINTEEGEITAKPKS